MAAPPVAPIEPDKVTKTSKPPKMTLGLEAMVGAGARLGAVSSASYTDDERGGLLFGGGVFFSPDRMFAFGVSYAHMGGGREQLAPGSTALSGKISRTFHSVLANVRAYPYRTDTLGIWGGLMVGATFHTATTVGSDIAGSMPAPPPAFTVDTGPNAGLALGLGAGLDFDISNEFVFLTSINWIGHHLPSDNMSGGDGVHLVPGPGTVNELDVRAAFQYRFDLGQLGGSKPPVNATVNAAQR